MQIKKYLNVYVDLLLLSAFCLIPFRGTWNNSFIGEPFDARLMIVVHEHWSWVFRGQRDFNDLRIFYPFDNTLGYTDAFLLDGIIHSILRAVGFTMLNAWNLTNMFILILGTTGFYFLLKLVIKNRIVLLILIFLICNNYTLIAYMHLWPNIIGYLLISWPFLFLYKIYSGQRPNLYLNIFLVSIPLYSLSYWYPAWFLMCTIISLLIFSLFKNNYRKNLVATFNRIRPKLRISCLVAVSPIWIFLWHQFFTIYVSNIDKITRDREEIFYGPTINDFFSTKLLGGSPFQFIYEFLQLDNSEQPLNKYSDWIIGFSPLMVVFVILAMLSTYRDKLNKYAFFGIIAIILIFTNFNGFGLFIYLWNEIELLQVIRVPSRFNLYVVILSLIIIFRYVDIKLRQKYKLNYSLMLIISLLLIIDNYRNSPGRWGSSELINSKLLSNKTSVIQNCEYFSVTNPGAGHWSDTMDGMVFSALTNLPTLNGYSGTSPSDGIIRNWSDPSDFQQVKEYVERQKLSKQGCIVSNDGFTYVNAFSPSMVSIQNQDLTWEQNRTTFWTWQQSRSAILQLNDVDRNRINPEPEMIIAAPPCTEDKTKIYIKINDETFQKDVIKDEQIELTNDFAIDLFDVEKLEISTNFQGCFEGNDPRKLFFRIIIPRN